MYNHGYGAAEDGIGPKFGTMTHAVMSAISCYGNSRAKILQLGKHFPLITLPVEMNCWEELAL